MQLNVSSLFLFALTSMLLIVSGLKRQPGLGVIGAVVIALAAVWVRGENLASFGFRAPESWAQTLLLGLFLGLLIQLLSVTLIEPLSDRLTRSIHDHSLVEGVRGNWRAFLQWLVAVWLVVAVLEEAIYRGFLMTEFARFASDSPVALLVNLVLTSVVFGLSHGYQGRSGMLSTGIIGLILGGLYAYSSFNLWLPILTHGFIDTVGIGLVALGADQSLRRRLWGKQSSGSDPGDTEAAR